MAEKTLYIEKEFKDGEQPDPKRSYSFVEVDRRPHKLTKVTKSKKKASKKGLTVFRLYYEEEPLNHGKGK